jgi:hypothetical protein
VRDLIPPPVFESIQQHLRRVGERAASGWESNKDEEDSLTGDLGRLLRTDHNVLVAVDGDTWRWRIDYNKFRGRGPGAFEAKFGADGIIQIEVTVGNVTSFKGVLFQAKKDTGLRNAELRGQVKSIEDIAPGGSAVLVYRPAGYVAIKGAEYLNSEEGLVGPAIRGMRPLGSFFDEFLECRSGLRGMYYEAVRERLLLPSIDGEIRAVPLEVGQRIKIQIASS